MTNDQDPVNLVCPSRVSSRVLPWSYQVDLERGCRPYTNTEANFSSDNAPIEKDLATLAHTRSQENLPASAKKSQGSSTSTLAAAHNSEKDRLECTIVTEKGESNKKPPKYSHHWMNVLRWEWLSIYRRLNLIVVTVNIIIVIVFAAQHRLTSLDPGAMSTALAANVMVAVLLRQEYVVNALFLVFGRCPPSWPLGIRRLAAKIYHFGGVHSGASIASIIWLALFDMSLALSYRHGGIVQGQQIAVVTITALLNILLCAVVLTSLPKIREKYHNAWELTHRFGGWLAVALFWVVFGLLLEEHRSQSQPRRHVGQELVNSPVFWMLILITASLIAPWLRLRKVPVSAEYQSKFAIRLHFSYTNLPLCAAPRLSTSPLREWHSFAGIPEESGDGFSVLISGAGDWTRKIIANPPTKLWVRGIPVRGVLHIARIFTKVVLVATGSGIGPILSLLLARKMDCRILWVTRDPAKSYQPDIVRQVLNADPRAQIMTRVKGQQDPNLGSLAHDLVRESGAEAVFVISNKEGCRSARIWLESRGVAVFTPIFDS